MKKSKAFLVLLVFLALLAGITYVDVKGIDGQGKIAASDITLGLDLAGGVSITYKVEGEEEPSQTDMNDTIEKLKLRVYSYSNEALVYQEGTDRINVEIPGVNDAEAVLAELGKPGTLYFIRENGSDGTPNYTPTMAVDEQGNMYTDYIMNKTIDEIVADGCVALTGLDVKSAEAASMRQNQDAAAEFCVKLLMTEEGTKKFADATTLAAAKGETLGIYYDGKVISAPSVSNAILGGEAQITGNFTHEEVEKLASQIRIGGLKLELTELHSKVVGAQLGSEAISTSLKAAAIGLGVIIVFMILVYFLSGFAASLALLMYTALIIFLLNGFDLTLTLPGIAGIILSIGMAVDANVIIFARIREELATGKTVKSSMKIGFDKALSAIIDGNVTTLIAALVLWVLGSGSIRGFAQTLVLGIALSMFTALFITRWLMNALYAMGCTSEKWYGVAKPHKAFDFVGKKVVFFVLSGIIILGGFVMMGVNQAKDGSAFNLSLDFVGGTSATVRFTEEKSLSDLETNVIPEIEAISNAAVQPQPVRGTNDVVFKTNSLDNDQIAALKDMLVEKFQAEVIDNETISATISGEMQRNTIIAVLVAIVFMLIYIRVRFKDIRFGLSSVMALAHDVLVVLAFYAVAKVSVGSTFVACMLTIVGYSINATIVIFDRIRENLRTEGKKSLKEIVNLSVSQTLSRSIFTSLTTLVMVSALYVLGVTAIKEFALPLMIGIICGAYSSVFLAGSLYYIMCKKEK